ncbi:hypothetical protein NBRC116592_35770 [Colwellia sp. KU-HH00111]|uniref:DUF3466 family protein n=1 Tax=Colwellia sp. KU-HH00111 TaxID=3127652 RepID=UPI00310B6D02
MVKLVKNIIALSISSALSLSFITHVNASTYQIDDKGEVSNLKYTYAQQQNSSADMVISGTNVYNFPIQFQYLDDDDFTAIERFANYYYQGVHSLDDIEDAEALRAGTPTANDLAWVVRWLQSTLSTGKGKNIEYQKVGDTLAITNIDGVSQDFSLWDTTFEGTDTLTRSTTDIISGITNTGILYGTATAPYLPSDVFTNDAGEEHTYWLREHGIRGFFAFDQGSQVYQLIPIESGYGGGTSAIVDANDAGVAVGFSSYKMTQSYLEAIEGRSDPDKSDEDNKNNTCADPDIVPGDMTLEACIEKLHINATSAPYHSMAIKATFDTSGAVVIEQLGLLATPHEDDERAYSSYALAINNDGVAVGYADGFYDETVTEPKVNEAKYYQYAVLYKGGEVIDLSGDHSLSRNSRAYDINDAGIAVGHITKQTDGKYIQKFFYADTSVPKEEINMVTPDDYFSGSESTVRAINNNNLMVGEGEIETHNESSSNPRRTAAFVYDMNDDLFKNLNDTIPCNLRQKYDIFEARDINDDGIISATAIVKVERRDAKGNIMLDDNGTPLTEDVVRAISLTPSPEDGETCSAKEEDKVIRQGASISFGSLLSVMALLGFRRKFFK